MRLVFLDLLIPMFGCSQDKLQNNQTKHNKMFYYTGYVSTGSTRFDYKTFPDPTAVEVLLPDKQQWVPYYLLSKEFLSEYYLKFLV